MSEGPKLVENVTQAIMSPSSKPRWDGCGPLYGGRLIDHMVQSRNAEMDNLERAFLEGRIDDKTYDAQMDAIMKGGAR